MLHEENPETREGERYRKSLERDLQITAPVDNVTAWSDATCTRRFSSLKSSRKTCISISMYTDRCNYPFYLRQLSTSQLFILSKRKCTIPPLLPRSSKEFHLHWVSLSHSNLPSNPPTPPDIYIYIYRSTERQRRRGKMFFLIFSPTSNRISCCISLYQRIHPRRSLIRKKFRIETHDGSRLNSEYI